MPSSWNTGPWPHPSEMARVTVDSVSEYLASAGVDVSQVWPVRLGVVRIEVVGFTPRRRRQSLARATAALEQRKRSDHWGVLPASRLSGYRWKPWRRGINVTDPGLDYHDPDSGGNWLAAQVAS
jgi:hypothetical protein